MSVEGNCSKRKVGGFNDEKLFYPLKYIQVKWCRASWEQGISPSQPIYLRNRKHVLCFYRVLETRADVWENKKCYGNTSHRRVFQQLFQILPNFHKCFYKSMETWRTCFLLHFLLENAVMKRRKTTCWLWLSKCKFSLLVLSLHQRFLQVFK